MTLDAMMADNAAALSALSGGVLYRQVEPADVPPATLAAVVRVMPLFLGDLGLDPTDVQLVWIAGATQADVGLIHVNERVRGMTRHDKPLYLRGDMGVTETVSVLGHELLHCWQSKEFGPPLSMAEHAFRETQAITYAADWMPTIDILAASSKGAPPVNTTTEPTKQGPDGFIDPKWQRWSMEEAERRLAERNALDPVWKASQPTEKETAELAAAEALDAKASAAYEAALAKAANTTTGGDGRPVGMTDLGNRDYLRALSAADDARLDLSAIRARIDAAMRARVAKASAR